MSSIVSVFAYRPLEVAVETATINLIDWLVTDHGYSATDAYCLVSTCPDFRINVYQMCKVRALSYVAGAELPKRYLPGQSA
jgi:acetamidase/formamidase